MIHFQHPQLLWLLLLVPAFVGLWLWVRFRNKKRLEQFADRNMFGRLIPDASNWRPAAKFGLLMLALAFLIITLANPQEGSRMVKGERLGSDIAVCLDVSNSMMAEDIQPNRLERSKRIVNNLLNALGSDRISLVVFAGSSYVQMPLTNDYSAVKLFLDQIDCSLISAQGTAIGDAIEKAMETFGYGDPDREWVKKQGRAIVVISDGENFEDDAEAAAREAAAEGVRICTIGMGLPTGTPIPEYRNGRPSGYKRDNSGNTVTTHLDEATLTAIAHAGKGVYVRATNINSGVQEVVSLIESLEKENYGEAMFSEYESRYQYPLAAALLCLLAELLFFERRSKRVNLDKILRRSLSVAVLLMLFSGTTAAQSRPVLKETRHGNRAYKAKKYDQAEISYRRALQHDSNAYRAQHNLGNTLYRQKKYAEAAQHYEQALRQPDLDSRTRSRILHNQGNSLLQEGLQKDSRAEGLQQFQQAVSAYQESLKLDPKNNDTRYNLSYAKKMLQQAQQQQQQQQQNKEQNKDQNKDQQKQNNQDNQQNKDQNQQNQKQKQQNQDQQQQKQDRQQQQQQRQQQQKKQDAERLLEAVKNNEKNTMKENAKKVETASPRRIEKDW